MSNIAMIRELADNYKRSIGTSSYDEAKELYENAAHEMLPGLIAVAEAAEKMCKDADAVLRTRNSCAYNPDQLSPYSVLVALAEIERLQLP